MAPGELNIMQVAYLARLKLTAEETAVFQKQLGEVLRYAENLRGVDTSGVEVSAHETPRFNIWRADAPGDCFTAEEALCNAPQQRNDLFLVNRVFE